MGFVRFALQLLWRFLCPVPIHSLHICVIIIFSDTGKLFNSRAKDRSSRTSNRKDSGVSTSLGIVPLMIIVSSTMQLQHQMEYHMKFEPCNPLT